MNLPGTTPTRRECEELRFSSHDQTALFYRHWPALNHNTTHSPRAIVLFHRGHEHSGRMRHLVDELCLPGFAFFAWDARGLGRSAEAGSDDDTLADLTQDVECFVQHIVDQHGYRCEDLLVIGQSVGATLLATWVHDYAPRIRAMVLAAPAFKIKLYVPLAIPLITLRQKLFGPFTVNSYVKAHHLSHDPVRIDQYNSDTLITRPILSRLLLDLFQAGQRCVLNAHAIQVPTLTLISGSDWVVEKPPQYQFMARLGSRVKQLIELPGFFHDTLGERHRAEALSEVRRFVIQQYQTGYSQPDLTQADQQGQGFQDFKALTHPATGLERSYWRCLQKGVGYAAGLSEGYRIGMEAGFDSGAMLDYVYQNQPCGKGWLGRQIDKNYLNSVGWQGIRQRKENLENMIHLTIDRLYKQNLPVDIVDIAAGQGRYLLDAIEPRKEQIDSLLLRDFSQENVQAGSQAIKLRALEQIARFEWGDAFDPDSLATLPASTLAVVSGLYELFNENAALETSLNGLASKISSGGYLIYTNQPWHPQQALIARVLTSHRGHTPWVMRCRSQAEMDQLVDRAGFSKSGQLTDRWGIFTVSLARKR